MSKQEALNLIVKQRLGLVDPVQMLHLTWLLVIIRQIPDDKWNEYVQKALPTLSS